MQLRQREDRTPAPIVSLNNVKFLVNVITCLGVGEGSGIGGSQGQWGLGSCPARRQ